MSHYDDIMEADSIDSTVKKYYEIRNADVVTAMNSLNFFNDGVCQPEISPVVEGHEVRGRALTVRLLPTNRPKSNFEPGKTMEMDHESDGMSSPRDVWEEDFGRVLHEFLDITEPGDIICVDMGGHDYLLGGDHLSLKCLLRGAVGMVLDGGMRDSRGINEVNFPVWSKYVAQKEPFHELELDAINVPINLGGVKVRPGDLVCCDPDGVVVVPEEYEDEVYETATSDFETDVGLREGKVELLQKKGVDIDIDQTPPSRRSNVPANLGGVDDETWQSVIQTREEKY